jgi:hypothetical protein
MRRPIETQAGRPTRSNAAKRFALSFGEVCATVSKENTARQACWSCCLLTPKLDPFDMEETMKHSARLILVVLCFTSLLLAKDNKQQQKEMNGTICNSRCVVPQNGVNTCDVSCTDKDGDCVLVDDKGEVSKIDNPNMAMPHMGKHVKIKALPTEKEREKALQIMQIDETKY